MDESLPGLAGATKERRGPGGALVAVPPGTCPACGSPTDVLTVDEPALLRHGGYGATRRRQIRLCPPCGWRMTAIEVEVRPEG